MAATRNSIARAVRQVSCSAGGLAARRQAQQAGLKRCQWQQQRVQMRCFSVGRMLKEKQYTQDHEWIEMSPDGKTCTLGISTYAAKALGDVVYIELPTLELEIGSGDAIGAVESVKSASDILSPVGGKVVEVNSLLEEKPAEINRDPEGEAWIARIEVEEGGAEVEGLMSKEKYREFTEEE